MRSGYDAVVVGAGHNGLVAAAYLARAGKSVVVLERRSDVGGTVGTEEFAPGFRGPTCFPTVDLFHPSIVDDLGLPGHGFAAVAGRMGGYAPLGEGAALRADPNGNGTISLTGVGAADASAVLELQRFLRRLADVLHPVFTAPLPALEDLGVGDALDLLKLGWRLKRLGADDAAEALRYLPMCVQDVLDERLEGAALKGALAQVALTGSWLGPRSPGSAYGLLHHRPAWYGPLFARPRFARGGPGGLTGAIAAAARAAGAVLRTDCTVERITVDRDAVRGVVLADGEAVRARHVLSGADPRATLLRLVEPGWLDPDTTAAVRGIRGRGTAALVRFALDAPPPFATVSGDTGDLSGRIQIASTLEYLERSFDGAKYGRLPDELSLECFVPTFVDSTLAPDGKHVMVAWTQFVPRHLASGTWPSARDALGDAVVATLERYAPGLTERILARDVVTPHDLEERFGLTDGCPYHVELALDQLLYMRPIPGWYRYRTPIAGLYLCGSGTHGGGGVTGLPGRNCARQVLEDARRD